MPGSTAALALSAAALAEASVARQQACKAMMRSFDAKTADVTQSRDYAACVQTVYGSGEPMTGGEAIAIKVVIVFALLGLVLGVWHGAREGGVIEAGLLGMMGACVGVLLPILLAVCFWAVQFLFS